MADECPRLLEVFDSTGQEQAICITELLSVFPNGAKLLQKGGSFSIYEDLQVFWMIVTGTLAFFMRMGFTMIQLGMVARRNIQTILFMNIMDTCLSCMSWLIVGYGFAWGKGSGFIGLTNFLGSFSVEQYSRFFYTWSFCSFSSTIVSGSLAERCTVRGWLIYSTVITTLIYPVVCHWFWSMGGWLSSHNPNSLYPTLDYSGAFSTHLVGGCCALMGSIIIGPRRGRFPAKGKKKIEFGNTDVPTIMYGTIAIWYGWYGFNCGATLAFSHDMVVSIRAALMNTFAAGSGGIVAGLLGWVENRKINVPGICFGVISGLVSVTGSSHLITPGFAIIIGMVAGGIFFSGCKLLAFLKIDDPVYGIIVHGMCGAWAGIAAAIFAEEDLMAGMYEAELDMVPIIDRLRNNILGIVCVIAWACSISGVVFYLGLKTGGFHTLQGGYGGGLDMVIFGMPAYKDTEEYTPEDHDNHDRGNQGLSQYETLS